MYIDMSSNNFENDISNNIIECTICLEPVLFNNNNDGYILECCKNYIHLTCLNNWCKNKNINKCFICNQENILINEMSNNITLHITNDISYIPIIDETIPIQQKKCCPATLIYCFAILFLFFCLGNSRNLFD